MPPRPTYESPLSGFDAFLTHDWGTDSLGRKNHDRVAAINVALKKRGVVTWFDSDRMTGVCVYVCVCVI